MSTAATIKLGLRFKRDDARLLEVLAERVRALELPDPEFLFDKAAEAARLGDPLIVECEHADEAKLLAAAFVRYGVSEPTIQELSPDGKPR